MQSTLLRLLVPIPLELNLLLMLLRFVWAGLHNFTELVLDELFLALRHVQFLLQVGNLGAVFLGLRDERLSAAACRIELAGHV